MLFNSFVFILVFLPITCFALAMTTFISQNLGAKQYERAKKGSRFGIVCCVVLAQAIGLIIYTFAPQLIGLFDRTPEVIQYGTMHARTTTLFFFLLSFSHCIAGILRGAGKSIVPMIVMLICWCVIRVTFITITTNIFDTIRVVYIAYPLTWSLSSIAFLIYYLRIKWDQLNITTKS